MAVIPVRITNPNKVFTPVFFRLWNTKKRFVVNKGGTGSSKSFSAAQKEVLISCEKQVNTLVIRKVTNTLKRSVIASFRKRISEFKLQDYFIYNKTDMTITNKVTGSQFLFSGLDDPEKMKSIEGIQRIFVEEATELDIEDFFELNRRARGFTDIQITLNFNPIHENHWLKKYFFDSYQPEAELIHSTYLDNPFLTQKDREQIEWLKEFNYNQYRIYALGDWGITENNTPWLFAFDEEKHIKPNIATYNNGFPIYLSFDFNREPISCIAVQQSPNKGYPDSFVHFIKEFTGDMQLSELCQRIKATFPSHIFFVTGDASGSRGDLGFDKRHDTYYNMIQGYLNLSNKQMNLLNRNLEHHDSRNLCNTLLHSYPNVYISREGCPTLINDCIIATVDEKSNKAGHLKKDRDIYKMDMFDTFRYFWQCYFKEYAAETYLNYGSV